MSDPKEKRVQEILDEAMGFGGHSAWLADANITAVVRVLVERVAALEALVQPPSVCDSSTRVRTVELVEEPSLIADKGPINEGQPSADGERNVCVICGQSGDFSSCPNCDGDRGLVRYVRLDSFKLRAELEAVKRERDELRFDFANACDVGRRSDVRLRQVLTELDEDQVEREKAMAVVESARVAAVWYDRDGSVGMRGAVFDELKEAIAAFDAKEGKPWSTRFGRHSL